MTVSYNRDVFNASFWSFVRTMLRWHGSLWKMIYAELIIWCLLFTLFTLIYPNILSKLTTDWLPLSFFSRKFENILTFMLGFYVSLVVTRWQNFWKNIGWTAVVFVLVFAITDPYSIKVICPLHSLIVTSSIFGYDERSLMIRRTIMRYLCCMQVLVFRSVSKPVKRRFPTLQSLVDYIVDLRTNLTYLFWNDWVSVPILYTQVIFLIVRLYFLVMVLGRQFLDTERHSSIDPYVPVISIIQFTFLIGWSKVAEGLLNPFGDDDDDFEMNYIIDRNLRLSMATVSNPQNLQPKLSRDKFFDDPEPVPFYSLQSVDKPQNPNLGSAALMEYNFFSYLKQRL
uniref:Bestrophin homolog n=1 Tax=Syphacia muris TaxID=451379 RepID=A0A0N5AFK9_9BILA